ncbi:hypothetical protein Ancab_024560, partial [Ancistrocladus abbreviatus]
MKKVGNGGKGEFDTRRKQLDGEKTVVVLWGKCYLKVRGGERMNSRGQVENVRTDYAILPYRERWMGQLCWTGLGHRECCSVGFKRLQSSSPSRIKQ